jgi:uncharacterized protein (UPF0335 family)
MDWIKSGFDLKILPQLVRPKLQADTQKYQEKQNFMDSSTQTSQAG